MIEYKRRAKKRRAKRLLIALGIILLVACMAAGMFFICTVRQVEVVGNENYSGQKIEEIVLPTRLDHNTLYLLYKSRYGKFNVPPFLDMVEVDVLSYNKVRIHVYEKTVMGYVVYGGNYVYFDKDGIVLEISDNLREGLPVVRGLHFDEMELYEKLPVKDQAIFRTLVTLTQMLTKEKLSPDRIEFTDSGEIDITFQEVLVHLGKDAHLDNKIARLTGILPYLEGRTGILHMEDVDENTSRITFTKTAPPTAVQPEDGEEGDDYIYDEEGGEDEYFDDSGDAGEYDTGEDASEDTDTGEYDTGGDASEDTDAGEYDTGGNASEDTDTGESDTGGDASEDTDAGEGDTGGGEESDGEDTDTGDTGE